MIPLESFYLEVERSELSDLERMLGDIAWENVEDIELTVKCGNLLSARFPRLGFAYFSAAATQFSSSKVILRNRAVCAQRAGLLREAGEGFLSSASAANRLDDALSAVICFLDAGLMAESEKAFKKAEALCPEKPPVLFHFLRARLLILSGRYNESRNILLSILQHDPGFRPAAEFLLIAAAESGDAAAVSNLVGQLRRNGWLNPDLIESVLSVLMKKSQFMLALKIFQATKAEYALSSNCYHFAIEAQRGAGNFKAALTLIAERKEAHPDAAEELHAIISEVHTLGQLGSLSALEIATEKARRIIEDKADAVAINPWMIYSFIDDPKLQKRIAENHVASMYQGVASDSSREHRFHDRDGRDGVLRVGILSAELKLHPVGEILAEVLKTLPAQLEVFLLSLHFNSDSMTERLSSMATEFIPCAGLDYDAMAAACDQRGIDILIDTTVHTAGGRVDYLARRLAPIQISFLGFSGTSGANFYDYIVADDYIVDARHEEFYSERVVRLPLPLLSAGLGGGCPEGRNAERLELGVEEPELLFGALAQPYKRSKSLVLAWARILVQVPNSKILIPESGADEIWELLVRSGVDRSRILRAKFRQARQGHLRRLSACDLFLDTYPYNAHSLAADAISSGVPVVAFAGESFASRVSGSLMHGIGLGSFVARSQEEYVATAVDFANSSPAERSALRDELLRVLACRDWSSEYSAAFFDLVFKVLKKKGFLREGGRRRV